METHAAPHDLTMRQGSVPVHHTEPGTGDAMELPPSKAQASKRPGHHGPSPHEMNAELYTYIHIYIYVNK